MIDAAVFTAGSNARAAIELMGPPVESMQVVAFGEPSAQVAREVGLRVDAVAPTQNAAGIIAALVKVFEE
jgi:uroporphyrinogen-III synthase